MPPHSPHSHHDPKQANVILSVDEIKAIVKSTVHETLTSIGVDIEDPIAMQADLKAVRDFRKLKESITRKVALTATTTVVVAFLTLVVLGFVQWIKGKLGGGQ